jgi:hypothetical protein
MNSAMSQDRNEDVVTPLAQVTDPDFQRLSAPFRTVVPVPPEEIPFSQRMEAFLDLFPQEFASEFTASDADMIEAYREAWWQEEYLVIINTVNAQAFGVLSPFYEAGFEELATGGIVEYVAAVEQVEAYAEESIASHHNELLKGLSSGGRARVSAILSGQIAERLSDSMLPTFDLRGFATAYPGVMARQLIREASQINGPPPELEIREIRQGGVVMVGTFPKEEK